MAIDRPDAGSNAGCGAVLLAVFMFWHAACSQADSAGLLSQDSICGPNVIVSHDKNVITFCLDPYRAIGDSCTEIVLRVQKPYCADVRFNCASGKGWLFDTVAPCEDTVKLPPVHADVVVDDSGFLRSMRLVFGEAGDSSKVFLDADQNREMPKMPGDTTPADMEYVLRRTAFQCVEKQETKILVERTLIYPAGYMRREPVYNYPELAMFHCGTSIRMPSAGSVSEYGYFIVYEHILHPPPLKYNEKPEKYIDDKIPKEKPKKPGFFKVRPLR
jgi:hypothetical protein